jgi:hypothetical protein
LIQLKQLDATIRQVKALHHLGSHQGHNKNMTVKNAPTLVAILMAVAMC